jgi:hypothetical protein
MGFFGVVYQITPSCRNECICVTTVLQIVQTFPSSPQALTRGGVGENFRKRVDARAMQREWLQSVEAEVLLTRVRESPEHSYERRAL